MKSQKRSEDSITEKTGAKDANERMMEDETGIWGKSPVFCTEVFDLYSEYGREHMKNLKPIAA
jgi:hypothetical protein